MKKYTIKWFINKFKKTKDEDWCVGIRHNKEGQMCAIGFTEIKLENDWYEETDETYALYKIFGSGMTIAEVNNNFTGYYTRLGKKPRTRILNYLKRKIH